LKLKDIGEFGLIDRIAGRVTLRSGVEVGIGDDAAVTRPTEGCLTLISTDMLVEGVHFDLSLSDPLTLGRKSLAVNLSDIAAMGGKPRHFLLSMAIPHSFPIEFLDGITKGMLELADEFDVGLIGGDTCASKGGLVLSITVIGEQRPEKIAQRSGAGPGDFIFVTGTLGDSALGLAMLKAGEPGGSAKERHLDPLPRVREGLALAEAQLPTAMIDVSDGLLADLGHILDKSSVGACVYVQKVPLSPFFREKYMPLTEEGLSIALSGGEDYELLFTAPSSREEEVHSLFAELGTAVTVIGEITAQSGLSLISEDGREIKLVKKGFNHFNCSQEPVEPG
jgi:thiamine-monophosphate kinase